MTYSTEHRSRPALHTRPCPPSFSFTTSAPTVIGQKYRVRMVYQGKRLQVYRRTVGSGSQTWAMLFEENDFFPGEIENDRIQFTTVGDAEASFDNIRVKSAPNFNEFLHLAANSDCIDRGDTAMMTITVNGQQVQVPVLFRDFSDQLGPVDGSVDTDPDEERDIGADEWPQPAEAAYWWESL